MLVNAAILIILIVVVSWVSLPLLRSERREVFSFRKRRKHDEQTLQEKKEDVYAAMKEMEFDFEMGKISEEDYQELRSQYKVKALEILKELDHIEKDDDLDAAIEREIQQFRTKSAPEEDIEAAIEREVQQLRKDKKPPGDTEREEKSVQSINFCPQCGEKVIPNSNFCQNCGMKLVFSQEEEGR